ncbi:MAG: DUF5081 family protein [Culicoidibacterales bacterium]
MTIVTAAELKVLNNLGTKRQLAGVHLCCKAEAQVETEQTIELLTKKGIYENGSLSEYGQLIVDQLDSYKCSRKHLYINQLRIAIISERDVVVIELMKDAEFKIIALNKVSLVKLLIEQSSFLTMSSESVDMSEIAIPMSSDAFEHILDGVWYELLIVQVYCEKKLRENKVYCMKKAEACCYDYLQQYYLQKTPKAIRLDLLELFELLK